MKTSIALLDNYLLNIPEDLSYQLSTVYSGYSGHVYSGRSDIVATFPGPIPIYSIIFRSDIVANWI